MSALVPRTRAPFGRRTCTITAAERVGAYTVLRCRDEHGPRPDPGQFYMLSAAEGWGGGEGERPFLPRAFSVLRACDGELHFLLEDVGPGTRRLCAQRGGEDLHLTGPLGAGFTAPAGGRRPLLVGGGVGIAPLAAWQDALGAQTRVLLGFRDAAHAKGARLLHDPLVCTDDGSAGRKALVTEQLADELDRDSEAFVYACGPPAMLEAVRVLCAQRGIPAQLALESGMACGFGACFGCVVETRDAGLVRLCIEGPVLDAARLPSALTPGAGH